MNLTTELEEAIQKSLAVTDRTTVPLSQALPRKTADSSTAEGAAPKEKDAVREGIRVESPEKDNERISEKIRENLERLYSETDGSGSSAPNH